MPTRVTDRLLEARRRRFVGRSDERRFFQSAITAPELSFQVLHVYGPGGVGKTTLLREFSALSEQAQIPALYLDARNIEASPSSFIRSLELAMGLTPPASFFEVLASRPTRHVILVDTFESLASIETWLREVFLPELPENVLVVLAGRNPPEPGWRLDPGWQSILHTLALRNLNPAESRAYLDKRDIPGEQQQAVLDFTHGHPLALSLVADAFAQRPGFRFQPEAAPDVIKTLLEQFVQKVPGPAHRAALEACAQVRVTTEALLGQMLQQSDVFSLPRDDVSAQGVHEMFEWLRGLSFIESTGEGLFPHDLARETLVADLRWRNPDWHKELHNRARVYYTTHIPKASGLVQQRLLLDLVFLHRDNAVIRSMFEWQAGPGIVPDAIRESDVDLLVDMVARHEGAESAALAARWLDRQPEGITVYRDENGAPAGFFAIVDLQRAAPAEIQSDPATRVAWEYMQSHAPLRAGEVAAHYRFWMARDTYQSISPVQTMILLSTVRYQLITPGLAYHFLPCSDPDFWKGAFTYANLTRLAAVDYTIGGKTYGVYTHDWRVEPPFAWLALLAEREVASEPQAVPPTSKSESLVVLSEPDFAGAVRAALHDYTHPDLLKTSPLVQSRMVKAQCTPGAGRTERAAALQNLIRQAAESLQSTPREAKLYRALYHTYLQPAATQEQAAEALDLPFSTFRRHLKSGIDRVTEILWQQEIGR